MGIHARIEPGGYVTIEVDAWLDQRTGGPDDDLTRDLRAWAARHTDTGAPADPDDPVAPGEQGYRDWPAAVQAWARQRGHELAEPELIAHCETRLDAEVWIVRATVGRHYTVAVVGINHDPPTVHADTCRDSWDWFDADSVDIICPAGHGWTWRHGRELLTASGDCTTLTVVFGADLDAPFTL